MILKFKRLMTCAQIRVLLHTDGLPANLRPYVELYLEAAYSLPIIRGGELEGEPEILFTKPPNAKFEPEIPFTKC